MITFNTQIKQIIEAFSDDPDIDRFRALFSFLKEGIKENVDRPFTSKNWEKTLQNCSMSKSDLPQFMEWLKLRIGIAASMDKPLTTYYHPILKETELYYYSNLDNPEHLKTISDLSSI